MRFSSVSLLVSMAGFASVAMARTWSGFCEQQGGNGICNYNPDDDGVSVNCDAAFPCNNNGDVCTYNDQDPTDTATCS